jgi:hypothetical protein
MRQRPFVALHPLSRKKYLFFGPGPVEPSEAGHVRLTA